MIVGCDPAGSHVAWAVFDHSTGTLDRYGHTKVVEEPRLRPWALAEALCEALEEHGYPVEEQVFYIEQPFGDAISGVASVERVIGGLLYCFSPRAELINVSKWKRGIGVRPVPKERKKPRTNWRDRRDAALATLQPLDANVLPFLNSKDMIKERVLQIFPDVPDNLRPPDIYDAIGIGYAGYMIYAGDLEP